MRHKFAEFNDAKRIRSISLLSFSRKKKNWSPFKKNIHLRPIENHKKRRIVTRQECPSALPTFRTNRQIIRERLEKEILNRLKFKPSDEQKSKIISICNEIEKELFKSYLDEKKYLAQYRRIIQNIKDRKYSLYKSLLKEKILPVDLVKMDSSQMLNTASKKFKIFIDQQRDADRVHLEKSAKEFNQRPICKGNVLSRYCILNHLKWKLSWKILCKTLEVVNDDYVEIVAEGTIYWSDNYLITILFHSKFKSISSSPFHTPFKPSSSSIQKVQNHFHNFTIL